MFKRTESTFVFFLLMAVCVIGYIFLQLLRKYTFANLFTFQNICSAHSIHLDYTSFYTLGKTIGSIFSLLAIMFVCKILFSIYKTHRKVSALHFQQLSIIPPVVNKISQTYHIPLEKIIIVKTAQLIAITAGIGQPKIVISSGLIKKLSTPQLEAVMLHEYHHAQNLHTLLFFVGEIISSSFNFLPVIGEVVHFFKMKLEHEADVCAWKIQHTSIHIEHALAKVRLSSTTGSVFPAFAQTMYSTRISKLDGLQAPLSIKFQSIVSSALVLITLFCLLYAPITVKAEVSATPDNFVDCSEMSHSACSTFCQPELFSFLRKEQNLSVEINSSTTTY